MVAPNVFTVVVYDPRPLAGDPDRDLRVALGDVDARGTLMNDIHHPAPSRSRVSGRQRRPREGQQVLNLILVLEATIHGSRGVLRVKLIYGLARTIVRRRRPRPAQPASPRTSAATRASHRRTLDHHGAGTAPPDS